MSAAQPLLFPLEAIPETATPVSETSPEWRDARVLRHVESIRFDPARLAAYLAAVQRTQPGYDATGFLDFVIEDLGGRSQ